MFMSTVYAPAQTLELPAPQITGGATLAEALSQRHSVREFDPTRVVTFQVLSNMLWSAVGINRSDTGMRTNPTALNTQEIDVYCFMERGIYLYDPKNNCLKLKAEGDHRGLIAGTKAFSQDFVYDAPVSLLFVADLARFETPSERNESMATLDAGIACENLLLYCSAARMASVPRVTMDTAGIAKVLGLPTTALPLINVPVGYAK